MTAAENEEYKHELLADITHAVHFLDDAMYVAMISFTFPVYILTSALYAKLTNRVFVFKTSNAYDLFICSLVGVWFWRFEYYVHHPNEGYGLVEGKPYWTEIVFKNIHDDIETGDFHFDWLIAAVSFFFWMRLLMMLQLTKWFGPLIAITSAMIVDMATFFGIFIINLLAFSCVGILIFAKLARYENMTRTFVMLFETSFGTWDLTMYDPLDDKKYIGVAFHCIFIIVNLLVLLNLVIAIMSDTYAILSEQKLGLYFKGVI